LVRLDEDNLSHVNLLLDELSMKFLPVEMIIKMKICGTSFELCEHLGEEAWLFVNTQHFGA